MKNIDFYSNKTRFKFLKKNYFSQRILLGVDYKLLLWRNYYQKKMRIKLFAIFSNNSKYIQQKWNLNNFVKNLIE
jgi:hypothetical protein